MASYDWLTIRPTSGTGPTDVTATLPTHSGYETRSKDVKVSATVGGTSTSKSVRFTQTGASIPGSGSKKKDGTAFSNASLSQRELVEYKGSTLSFELTNTNAKNIEYYVDVSGSNTTGIVNGVLNPPTISASIRPITGGTAIVINSLVSSITSTSDGFKITYSLPTSVVNSKIGAHQTYSLAVNAVITGTYSNKTSQDVIFNYGMNAIVATGTNMTGTTSVPITGASLVVSYPGSSGFVVGGGGDFTSVSSTSLIEIDVPTDVNWTAQVVDVTA